MTSRAIQISVTQVALAIAIGASIEGVLPKYNENAPIGLHIFETAVQVGLNGAALGMASCILRGDDPTFGIPFSTALYAAQPELTKRFEALSCLVKARVHLASLQMAAHVPVA